LISCKAILVDLIIWSPIFLSFPVNGINKPILILLSSEIAEEKLQQVQKKLAKEF